MPIEESLARIASALEVIADKLDNPLMTAKASPITLSEAERNKLANKLSECTRNRGDRNKRYWNWRA